MGDQPDEDSPRATAGPEGWGRASVKAALILMTAVVAFIVVPDRLVAYLSLHVAPGVRDTLVTFWVVVAFVGLARAFVVLQRRQS